MVARHFSDNESSDWLEDEGAAPIPQVSEDLFHVPVSENASADEAARLRVEEIMRELEEEFRKPRPIGAHARVENAEDQGASVGEREVPKDKEPVSAEVPEPEPAEAEDIDEPEMRDSSEGRDSSEAFEDGSVESTLVLDRNRFGGALHEPEVADEELDEHKRERLRVNPNPQDGRHETGLSVVPKEEPRRRFGFFAAIGAFVARVLHLDDR